MATLAEIVRMFEGQPDRGIKNLIEVSLTDIRTWHSDQQAIMKINNELRVGLLAARDLLNSLVK